RCAPTMLGRAHRWARSWQRGLPSRRRAWAPPGWQYRAGPDSPQRSGSAGYCFWRFPCRRQQGAPEAPWLLRWVASWAPSIHTAPRVRAVERKGGNCHVEEFTRRARHLVGTHHDARRRRQRTTGGVAKGGAGRQHRSLANAAGPLHLLGVSRRIGDAPMWGAQLHPITALVQDVDGVGPQIAPLVGRGVLLQELRCDADADAARNSFVHG